VRPRPREPKARSVTLATANSLAAIPDERGSRGQPHPAAPPADEGCAALSEAARRAAMRKTSEERGGKDFTRRPASIHHTGGYPPSSGQAVFKLGETDRAIADIGGDQA